MLELKQLRKHYFSRPSELAAANSFSRCASVMLVVRSMRQGHSEIYRDSAYVTLSVGLRALGEMGVKSPRDFVS